MYASSYVQATALVGFQLRPLALFCVPSRVEVSENLLRSGLLGFERSALVQRPRLAICTDVVDAHS